MLRRSSASAKASAAASAGSALRMSVSGSTPSSTHSGLTGLTTLSVRYDGFQSGLTAGPENSVAS